MTAFFDTNVAVYAIATDDPVRRSIAEPLFARHYADRTMVVSTQVLQESFNVLTRKKQLSLDQSMAFADMLSRAQVVSSTPEFVLEALRLSVDHQLSVWDALIVQAAMDSGCRVLYSEDLQPGRRFGRVEVVNPFAPGLHEASPPYARRRGRPRSGSVTAAR